jgi:hypothetical protein
MPPEALSRQGVLGHVLNEYVSFQIRRKNADVVVFKYG